MTNETTQHQRPELGIEAVNPSTAVTVTDEQFPWLSTQEISVPTVEVRLADTGDMFHYGSIVDGNNTIERLASDVSPQLSAAAERSMFKGLSMLLRRERTTSVELVPYVATPGKVYKTTGRGADAPRLFFGILSNDRGEPIVIKLGIATHKKQQQLLGILCGDSS